MLNDSVEWILGCRQRPIFHCRRRANSIIRVGFSMDYRLQQVGNMTALDDFIGVLTVFVKLVSENKNRGSTPQTQLFCSVWSKFLSENEFRAHPSIFCQ